jgi:hypothetical protein
MLIHSILAYKMTYFYISVLNYAIAHNIIICKIEEGLIPV